MVAQRVDDAPAVEPAQRRQRPLAPLPHPVRMLTERGRFVKASY
jgi:hypothetical protein